MRHAIGLVLLGLGLGLVLLACGAEESAGPGSSSASSEAPAPVATQRPITERCLTDAWGELSLQERRFTADDGAAIFGVEAGSGPRGVVLLPGTASQGVCNWATTAQWLVDDGYHVLVVDQRCQGYSDCPDDPDDQAALDLDALAATAELRERGARDVVVVGESRGGGVALAAAVRAAEDDQAPRIDAVVSLSGVWLDTYTGPRPQPVGRLVGRVDVPTLYLSARDDDDVDQRTYRRWAAATSGSEYAVWAKGGHGTLLLGDERSSAPYRRLEQFLSEQPS